MITTHQRPPRRSLFLHRSRPLFLTTSFHLSLHYGCYPQRFSLGCFEEISS
ncbi:hypothetical protein RchiOBHm_Chr2g0095871 [Rosa chinensis]|uniref:Uncharacterized protein n=1 Tax=Rosa chinensis TaxID=74649 RepID=A0A2P6RKY1_ROSCH|nr:hypothetical protein RchiOBHm_Chr2g0095871 [Rosa chinensis]